MSAYDITLTVFYPNFTVKEFGYIPPLNQRVITFRIRFNYSNYRVQQVKDSTGLRNYEVAPYFNICLCLQTRERCTWFIYIAKYNQVMHIHLPTTNYKA